MATTSKRRAARTTSKSKFPITERDIGKALKISKHENVIECLIEEVLPVCAGRHHATVVVQDRHLLWEAREAIKYMERQAAQLESMSKQVLRVTAHVDQPE